MGIKINIERGARNIEHKKYIVNGLYLEITRKCNKKCIHCCCGEAQNVTMETVMIDKLLSDIADVKKLYIGGGEPLLEIERIDYVVNQLITSQWHTELIEITTNGSICDRRLIDTLEKFCCSERNRRALLRISNDEFHTSSEYEVAYDFYKHEIETANQRIMQLSGGDGINLEYTLKSGYLPYIRYSGRAVSLVDNDEKYIHGENVQYTYTNQHQIRIEGNTIKCMIQVCANGNVCLLDENEFVAEDALSFGNIMDDSFTNIIRKNNHSCMILCSEDDLLFSLDNSRRLKLTVTMDQKYIGIVKTIYMRIIELRKLARNLYPHIPAYQIIMSLQLPSYEEIEQLLPQIYEHCPTRSNRLINGLWLHSGTNKGDAYLRAMCSTVQMYLDDKTKIRYPFELFGAERDILNSKAFKMLQELEEQCEAYPPSDSEMEINFSCAPGVPSVPIAEDDVRTEGQEE